MTGDMGKPPEAMQAGDKSKRADVERLNEAFLEEIRSSQMIRSNPIAFDIGQVARMEFPNTWTAGATEKKPMQTESLTKFQLAGDPDTKICLYDRGTPIRPSVAEAFHNLLEQAPHTLTESQFAALSEILRDKSQQYFSKRDARTEDLNGKRVLVVEGSFYKGKPDQVDNKSIYIDADGTGSVVQEIWYDSPKNKYDLHLHDANKAFKSIRWK